MNYKETLRKYGILFTLLCIVAVTSEYLIKLKNENNDLILNDLLNENLMLDINRRYLKEKRFRKLDSLKYVVKESPYVIDSMRQSIEMYDEFAIKSNQEYMDEKFLEYHRNKDEIK